MRIFIVHNDLSVRASLETLAASALQRSVTVRVRDEERRALQQKYQQLSRREREVMQLVIRGRLNKHIAAELGISEITVAITIHNYRWRLGLAAGESKYDAFEKKLATQPTIAVPTITLEGDANGAPHPDPNVYAKKFSGKYEHRLLTGGIGHNLPQEAPQAFAKAVIDADKL